MVPTVLYVNERRNFFFQPLKSLTEWDTTFAFYTTVHGSAHATDVSVLSNFEQSSVSP